MQENILEDLSEYGFVDIGILESEILNVIMEEFGCDMEQAEEEFALFSLSYHKAAILDSEDWWEIRPIFDKFDIFYEEYMDLNTATTLILA